MKLKIRRVQPLPPSIPYARRLVHKKTEKGNVPVEAVIWTSGSRTPGGMKILGSFCKIKIKESFSLLFFFY